MHRCPQVFAGRIPLVCRGRFCGAARTAFRGFVPSQSPRSAMSVFRAAVRSNVRGYIRSEFHGSTSTFLRVCVASLYVLARRAHRWVVLVVCRGGAASILRRLAPALAGLPRMSGSVTEEKFKDLVNYVGGC